ncbi:hypothetical protein [Noviherbaspirillum soli]|uniref:hypothetical protein n=1 Tax=Noviherbaspirillum soli TaxID=1064518 RepID=UPI00188A4DD7|nr:hypothetical protein [Noviherbaspirillum soli]
MLPATQRPLNAFPRNTGNQISHCNKDGGKVPFPESLTFRMPDGARFILAEINAHSSLKDLAQALHRAGGDATRAFAPIELGRSFNFSFNGRSYPANSLLSSVHEEINLNACKEVACEPTDAKLAVDRLRSGTGLEWRVLNENVVMLDSNPYWNRAQAADFAKDVLRKTPHLGRLIELEIKTMGIYSYATMRVAGNQSIRMIAEGIPTEISLAAPLIAQAVRSGDPAGFQMLPLDVLSRLGMFLAPEFPDMDACKSMQAEIEHASKEYAEAPVFKKMAPVPANGIRESIAATASLLLRGTEENAQVSDVGISSAGLTLYFNDALHAGRFIRTMKHAGYRAASLEWLQRGESNGGCAAIICIRDFNEIKRFVEATCGFAGTSTKELFDSAAQELRLPCSFLIGELEAIGASVAPISLEQKKAAARRLMRDYLPCLDPSEAGKLKDAVREKSAPDQHGNTGSLQYLREKRGIGRVFSMSDYSDDVATFREVMAAIDGLTPKAS